MNTPLSIEKATTRMNNLCRLVLGLWEQYPDLDYAGLDCHWGNVDQETGRARCVFSYRPARYGTRAIARVMVEMLDAKTIRLAPERATVKEVIHYDWPLTEEFAEGTFALFEMNVEDQAQPVEQTWDVRSARFILNFFAYYLGAVGEGPGRFFHGPKYIVEQLLLPEGKQIAIQNAAANMRQPLGLVPEIIPEGEMPWHKPEAPEESEIEVIIRTNRRQTGTGVLAHEIFKVLDQAGYSNLELRSTQKLAASEQSVDLVPKNIKIKIQCERDENFLSHVKYFTNKDLKE